MPGCAASVPAPRRYSVLADVVVCAGTAIEKVMLALGATPLLAVRVMLALVPACAAVGVPLRMPVLGLKVSQPGSPEALKVGLGVPVAVKTYWYELPTAAEVAAAPLVIVGLACGLL